MKALSCSWLDICVSELPCCVYDATFGAVLLTVNFVHRLESELVLGPSEIEMVRPCFCNMRLECIFALMEQSGSDLYVFISTVGVASLFSWAVLLFSPRLLLTSSIIHMEESKRIAPRGNRATVASRIVYWSVIVRERLFFRN